MLCCTFDTREQRMISHRTQENESLYIVIRVINSQYLVYFHANRPLVSPLQRSGLHLS